MQPVRRGHAEPSPREMSLIVFLMAISGIYTPRRSSYNIKIEGGNVTAKLLNRRDSDMKQITDGIFPTMLVLYTEDNKIDYDGMEKLLEWYIEKGVHGIFALCHSTEIHKLSTDEKASLAHFVMKTVAGRVPVVMAGAVGDTPDDQLREAARIIEAEPDAFVFIRNRQGKTEDEFKASIEHLIAALPAELPLGFYECPFPYKQFLTDAELAYAASTGRFVFLKDTCCDVAVMKRRAAVVAGSGFRLFNANCATYYESLGFGYNGFSGIMANFHPDLYSWVSDHPDDPRSAVIDKYLGITSVIEARCYPICAKKYLNMYEGFHICETSRAVADETVPALTAELDALHFMTQYCRNLIAAK